MTGSRKLFSFAIAAMVLISVTLSLTSCQKRSSSTLRVGLDDSTPPMEFKDEKGQVIGFDIDLAQAIGAKLGRKIEIVSTAWDGIFPALKARKFDLIISDVSITTERQKEFDFSTPYLNNSQVIVVKAGSPIKQVSDLKGRKIGVVANSTGEEAAVKLQKDTQFQVQKYDQTIQFFSDLKIGRIDALLTDTVTARYYVAQEPASYAVAVDNLNHEPLGLVFNKQDGLRGEVQKALDTLVSDGTAAGISRKWFGADLVSQIK